SVIAAAERLGRRRAPIELSADARAAVEHAIRRPSVFVAERRAIAPARTPEGAPRPNRGQFERLRQALAIVAGRRLPAGLRVYAPELAKVMEMIDSVLYGTPSRAREYPVLDLPTSDRLRPVVKKMRLRMPGAHINDVKRFQDLVVERLRARTYSTSGAAPAA